MSLWGELRRRNVVRVGIAYLAGAWVLLQVADLVLASFGTASWVMQALIFAAALAFPCALLLAWHYEITPEGVRAASDLQPTGAVGFNGRRIDFLIIGLLVLAVGFLAVDRSEVLEPRGSVLPNSVVVLPFENLSDDPENAFFAFNVHEEVMARLGRLTNLTVISGRSARRYENSDMSIPAIAKELNVETVMEGSLSYADDRVRITSRLIDAATDSELWSQVYDRDYSDIFAIQTDIATNIAVALEATLTMDEQRSIGTRPTDSVEAYELYLRHQAERESVASVEDYNRTMGLLDRALELDADFSLAWAAKSALLLGAGFFRGLDPRSEEELKADAEYAASRAVELAPDSGVAHSALANAATWREDWVAAEAEYREALAVGGEPGDYGFFQLAVGKAERAREYIFTQRELDPLNDTIAIYVAALYDSLGDTRAAMTEYERIPAFGAVVNQIITQLGTDDDLELIPRIGFEERILELSDTPDAALAELRNLYRERSDPVERLVISALAARFGDAEFSLNVMEGALDWMPVQSYMLWRPVFSDVRKLPRFKEVMSDHGFADYWREYGWPDFCEPLTDEDFECN